MQHFIEIDIIFRLAISFSISGSLMFPRDPAAWSGGEIMYRTPVLYVLQYYITNVLYICALCYNVLYCTPLLYTYTVPILPWPGSPALPSPVDTSSHITSRGLIISIIDVIIIIINGFIILIDDSIIIIDVSIIWRRGVEQSSVITIVEKY